MIHAQARRSAVEVPTPGAHLAGDLVVPPGARGVVAFAHGSGSSRHSPRNLQVAATLQEGGLATLLFDLLTPAEEVRDDLTAEHRFDIPLLTRRLAGAVDWLRRIPATAHLPIGLFGASTGAAAALGAAAARPDAVAAVVSRGGRPDLAGAETLARVRAPTLLIVGGLDEGVIELNRAAAAQIRCRREVLIVPGATHLFPEPGKLASVARLARAWFLEHCAPEEAGPQP